MALFATSFWLLHSLTTTNAYTDIIVANTRDQYNSQSITCSDKGDCKIVCSGTNSCYQAQIQCPRHFQCDITCSGINSCQLSFVVCPYGDSCSVSCNNDNSCRQMAIDAQYSSHFALHDCSTGDLSCNGMSLYVPPNNGQPRAIISNGESLTSSQGEILQFYAIFSWHDIEFQRRDKTTTLSADHVNGIMHCLPGYTAACNFAADSWSCSQSDDICNNPPTQAPTAAPTSSPTANPTVKPSAAPTPAPVGTVQENAMSNAKQTESEKQAEVLWVLTSVLLSILCLIMIVLTYYVLHARYRQKEEEDNPISIKYTRTSTADVDHDALPQPNAAKRQQRKSSGALSGFVQALQQGSHVQHVSRSHSALANNININIQRHSHSNSSNMHARNDTMLYKGDQKEEEEDEQDEEQQQQPAALAKEANLDEVDDEVTSLEDDEEDGDDQQAHKEQGDGFLISTDCGVNDKAEGSHVNDTRAYQQGKRSSIQVHANPLASLHQKHAYSAGGVYPRGSLTNLHHMHHKLNSYSHPHWNHAHLPTARSPYLSQSKSMQFEPNSKVGINLQRVNSNSSVNNSPFSYFAKPESFGITQPAEDSHIMAYSPFVQHSYSVPPSNLIYTQLQQASGSLLDIYSETKPDQEAMDLITSPKQATADVDKEAVVQLDQKEAVGPDTSDALLLITTNGSDEEEAEPDGAAAVAHKEDNNERKQREVDDIAMSAMNHDQHSASSQVAKEQVAKQQQENNHKTEAAVKPFPKGHPGFIMIDTKAPKLSKATTSRSSKKSKSSKSNKHSNNTLLSPLSTITSSTLLPQQRSYTQDGDDEQEQGESPLIIVNTRLTERDEDEEDEEDMDATNDCQMSEVPLDAIKYGASFLSTQYDETEMNGSSLREQTTGITQTDKLSSESQTDADRTPTQSDQESSDIGFDIERRHQDEADMHSESEAPGHRSQQTAILLAQSMQELEQQAEANDDDDDDGEDEEEDESASRSRSRSGSGTVFISQSTSSASASSSASNSSSGSVYDSDEEKIQWSNNNPQQESVHSFASRSFAHKSNTMKSSLDAGDIAEYYENQMYSHPHRPPQHRYGNVMPAVNQKQNVRQQHGNQQYLKLRRNDAGKHVYEYPYDHESAKLRGSQVLKALFHGKAQKGRVVPVKRPIDMELDDDFDEESQSLRGHRTHGKQHSTLEIQGLINM